MPVVIDHYSENCCRSVVQIFEVVQRRGALIGGYKLVGGVHKYGAVKELHANNDENGKKNQKQQTKRGKFW